MSPIILASPDNDEIGVRYPEKLIAGVTVIIAVAKIAAI